MVYDETKFNQWKQTAAGQQFADSLYDSKNAEGYWRGLGTMEKTPKIVPIIDPATGQPQINPNNQQVVTQQLDIDTWKSYKGQEFSPENMQNAIFDILQSRYAQ